ncbi:uncharacterized protein LOC110875735 [Helianthus annuus]|uniref:uncharacterized protein LOC110875735 n=1 Tax=Helianthus annuus TaxID=4232 RepID=UPI000B903DE1|nr:uncharacterized protein LOC110875735 [Helianthus annuus]
MRRVPSYKNFDRGQQEIYDNVSACIGEGREYNRRREAWDGSHGPSMQEYWAAQEAHRERMNKFVEEQELFQAMQRSHMEQLAKMQEDEAARRRAWEEAEATRRNEERELNRRRWSALYVSQQMAVNNAKVLHDQERHQRDYQVGLPYAEHSGWTNYPDLPYPQAVDSKRQAQLERNKKYPVMAPISTGATNARVVQMERENEALDGQLAKFKGIGGRDALHAAQTFPNCDTSGELGHTLEDCPGQAGMAEEDVNMVPNQGGQQYQNRQSNYNQNYNQGCYNRGNQRSYQPNQDKGKMRNQSEGSSNEMMEILKQIRKDQELQSKSQQALEKQVAQFVADVAHVRKDSGRVPSDTTKNPQHQGSIVEEVEEENTSETEPEPVSRKKNKKSEFSRKNNNRVIEIESVETKEKGTKGTTVPFPKALIYPDTNVVNKRGPQHDGM